MALDNIKQLKFDNGYNFDIQIINQAATEDGTKFFNAETDKLNAALKSVSIPTIASEIIDTYSDGRYRLARGKTPITELTFTFSDYDSLTLYKAFYNFYQLSSDLYLDEQFFEIIITHKNSYKDGKSTSVKYSKCLLTNLSEVSFAHNSIGEILEFSVGFQSNTPVI